MIRLAIFGICVALFTLVLCELARAQSFHEQWTVCVAFPGHCKATKIRPMERSPGEYRGKITVTYLSPAELQWKCVNVGALGCTTGRHTPGRCPIFIDKTLSSEMKKTVYWHEIEHCKGRKD